MSKRILSVILLICMLVNNLPAAAFAEESTSGCSHVCDESCIFVVEEVACDKGCQPPEEGGEIVHGADCAYAPAVIGSECTHKHNGQCGVACTHDYAEGVCAICGETEPQSQPCQHTGGEATCEALAVCGTCGASYGEKLAHTYGTDGKCACGAGCEHNYTDGVCSVCGMTKPCEHSGGEATCEVLAVCELCKESYGDLADHVYKEGKCACGDECEHTFAEGICTLCGMEEPETEPVCNCGTDDASIHATTCAVYAAPEKPECHCVEKCLEANIWCDVCGIDYSLCGGTGKAEAYTEHKHCLSVHEDCTDHEDAVTWQAWTKTNSLPTSGNYYLTATVTLSDRHKVSGTLNLCLNGYTIKPSESGFGAIEVAGNLSLTDCQGNGEITGFTNNQGKGGAVYVASGKQFTMYGGIISVNKVGARFYTDSMGGGVYSEGTFTMHGGTISGNEAQRFGGGVYIASGKQFTMDGGTISGNKVTTTGNAQTYGGGGVYVAGSNFTMSGGTISGNEAQRFGGGVCIGNNTDDKTLGTFAMSGGTISGNNALCGGGVYIDSRKQFTMSGGTISRNTSSSNGGGVYAYGCTFEMSNGTISGNNAGSAGGGVYINTGATVNMTGGKITGNAATDNGGGVYMIRHNTKFNLSGSPIISGNTVGNCYIDNNDSCFITVTGALSENANIGITTWSQMSYRPFCKPDGSIDLSNYNNWFFSDIIGHDILRDSDGSLYTKQVSTYALTFDSEKTKVTVRGIETKKAAAGDIVVISPIVPEGATVKSVTATGCTVTDRGDGTYSFTMPTNAVTITVTFNSPTVDVTGVTLDKDTLELAVGGTETLTATVTPDDATVSWTSSNTKVATVDENGKVTAVGAGTAIITVTTEDGSKTATCTVTVLHKHCLFGHENCTDTSHGGQVTFEPWDGTTPFPGGNVYLTGNVDSKLEISSDVNLCLNGHNVKDISISSGAALDLTDCTENPGTIADGIWVLGSLHLYKGNITSSGYGVMVNQASFTMDGGTISGCKNGGVSLNKSATFTMNDGTISDNQNNVGAGVGGSGTFTMNGGKITGNKAASNGGGVRVKNFTMTGGEITRNTAETGAGVFIVENGTLNISGNPVIKDNTGGNVYLGYESYYDESAQINVTGQLDPDCQISLTMEKPGMFLWDYRNTPFTYATAANFTSESKDYKVFAQTNEDNDEYETDFSLVDKKTITVSDDLENGTVTAPQSAFPGDQVTVTAEPNPGYAVDADSVAVKYGWNNKYSVDVSKNENGTYTFTMPANAVTVFAAFELVDKTAPSFSGVTNGNEYYTTQKVTVTETNLASLTCNGTTVTSPITLEGNKDITYEIVATDKAGNSSKITVNMKPIAELEKDLPTETTVKPENANTIDGVKKSVQTVQTDNATDAEKAALNAIVDRCDAQLKILSDVEAVKDMIAKLEKPTKISPDDIVEIQKYDDALKAYKALSDHGRELVGADSKAKLEKVNAALTAYNVIKGHKSSYVKGSYKPLTITSNGYYHKELGSYIQGAYGKFLGITVDGELLDPKHYSVESGSTVITLKTSYLETLRDGKHYITFLYTDDSTDGSHYFRISTSNGNPMTNDIRHSLWFTGMAVTSLLCAAMIIVFFPSKKGKYER